MKYLVYILQAFEVLMTATILTAYEYAEGILGIFMLVLFIFILFLALQKYYRVNKKFVVQSSYALLVIIAINIIASFFLGGDYFKENWKGMTEQQFSTMIMLFITMGAFQFAKLSIVKK